MDGWEGGSCWRGVKDRQTDIQNIHKREWMDVYIYICMCVRERETRRVFVGETDRSI